jgi:aspartyl-tRNA(Asn)/glutamyl-tRNA(Gln) amidotransferase subunit C
MLSIEEVEKIAKLANLSLTDDEVKIFQVQLSTILDYVKILDKVDTTGVEPTSHPIYGLKNRFSETVLNEQQLTNEEAIRNAKETNNGYILTKAVL